MEILDWIVLSTTLFFIVIYGALKTKGSANVKDYLLDNNETPWFTVGVSVMATQASAITFLSTPGQAYHDGMGFVQFYFGLPLAMIVIAYTFIPNPKRFRNRNYNLCSFHHFVSIIRLEFEYAKHYHWNFSDCIHCYWWNKSRECNSKTTNVCNYVGNVHYFFLHFSEFTSRS